MDKKKRSLSLVVRAGKDGPLWIVFVDGADLSDLDPDKIVAVDWVLTYDKPNSLSLIRANDAVHEIAEEMGVTRDARGAYSPAVYDLMYQLAFAEAHLRGVEGGDLPPASALTDPDREQILDLVPQEILAAFVNRTDPTRGVTANRLNFLRRPAEARAAEDKAPKPRAGAGRGRAGAPSGASG